MKKKITGYNRDKYITTPEFIKLSAEVFDARLAQVNLVTKTDFEDKLETSIKKLAQTKKKHLLVENEFKKLQAFYFKGKSRFKEDFTQNYVVFQPVYRYLEGWQVLVLVIFFIFGNLKDCLMKILHLLLPLLSQSTVKWSCY